MLTNLVLLTRLRWVQPDDAPDSGYATKFNATGGLDREGLVRDLLRVLEIGDVARPYATAERLAEVGLSALVKRIEAHESLAEILQEMEQTPQPDESVELDEDSGAEEIEKI